MVDLDGAYIIIFSPVINVPPEVVGKIIDQNKIVRQFLQLLYHFMFALCAVYRAVYIVNQVLSAVKVQQLQVAALHYCIIKARKDILIPIILTVIVGCKRP